MTKDEAVLKVYKFLSENVETQKLYSMTKKSFTESFEGITLECLEGYSEDLGGSIFKFNFKGYDIFIKFEYDSDESYGSEYRGFREVEIKKKLVKVYDYV